MEYKLQKMKEIHIKQASEIEKRCFSDAWSEELLKSELSNDNAKYFAITVEDELVAYCGYWNIVDDAQIMNVVVDLDHRGKKLGNILMDAMIENAISDKMATMSLEVRVSNEVAINLYKKYGFVIEGRRKNYYQDNNEDAYIMFKYLD